MRKCAQSMIICTYALNVEKVWKTLSKKAEMWQKLRNVAKARKEKFGKNWKKYSLSWEKVTKVEIS